MQLVFIAVQTTADSRFQDFTRLKPVIRLTKVEAGNRSMCMLSLGKMEIVPVRSWEQSPNRGRSHAQWTFLPGLALTGSCLWDWKLWLGNLLHVPTLPYTAAESVPDCLRSPPVPSCNIRRKDKMWWSGWSCYLLSARRIRYYSFSDACIWWFRKDWAIRLYFSTVKILAQRLIHIYLPLLQYY